MNTEETLIQDEETELQENDCGFIKMDFTLKTPEERTARVAAIVEGTPPEKLTPSYLEKLSDYILLALPKEERQTKKILTQNHMVTVNKRETSYEGLITKMENGEDGIYNMIANDKNIIFQPKISITEEDVAEIPGMRELREAIANIEEQRKTARGKRAFSLCVQLRELRQDQYILKAAYRKPIFCMNLIKSFRKIDLSEEIGIAEDGRVISTGLINFFNKTHIQALLSNYSKLKEETWDSFDNDARWLLLDFESIVDKALKDDYPLLYDLMILKIDKVPAADIQTELYNKYGVKHSIEYLSSLWRNKIPTLIAQEAENEWLIWHYTIEERGKWKRCSRCGEIKLAHNNFFSKNGTSKDGYYSICKKCRNGKNKIRKKSDI